MTGQSSNEVWSALKFTTGPSLGLADYRKGLSFISYCLSGSLHRDCHLVFHCCGLLVSSEEGIGTLLDISWELAVAIIWSTGKASWFIGTAFAGSATGILRAFAGCVVETGWGIVEYSESSLWNCRKTQLWADLHWVSFPGAMRG